MRNEQLHSRADNIYCVIYSGVLVWLLVGIVTISSAKGLTAYALYVASFVAASYMLFQRKHVVNLGFLSGLSAPQPLRSFIVLIALVFPLLHWMQIGHIPLLYTFSTSDYWEAVLIRQNIFEDAAALWRYGSRFTVAAIMPFLILLFYVNKRRYFWIFAIYSLFYAASLMQKSLVVAVFLPTIIYALGQRNFKLCTQLAALSTFAVLALMAASNPHIRPQLSWAISSATAATVESSHGGTTDQGWTAYGIVQKNESSGKFKQGSLYFSGATSVHRKQKGSEWEIGSNNFWMELWIFPLKRPEPGKLSAIYWNGPDDNFQGASYINYGTQPSGTTYLEFGIADVSGKRSLAIYAKDEVKLQQWNHIYIGRSGNDWYLALNGRMAHGKQDADLSLKGNTKGIVQFGARFAGEVMEEDNSFFKGYIDEISFSKQSSKFTTDFSVPSTSSSRQSLKLTDITNFEPAFHPTSRPQSSSILPGWASTLVHRVLFMPGEVVEQWFAIIPEKLPYAYGCGYRPLAALIGCSHQNFSELVYAHYNPKLLEKGVYGTMNAASFMEDYANFGLPGLVVGGVVLALLLYMLGILFSQHRSIGVALNIVPLLYLSSTALLSLLLSGGWILTILLYVIYYTEFNKISEGDVCAG